MELFASLLTGQKRTGSLQSGFFFRTVETSPAYPRKTPFFVLFQCFVVMNQLDVRSFDVRFEKSIIRNTSSSDEKTALTTAEDLNYSGIFNMQRYATLAHARDAWPFTWPISSTPK